MHQTPIIQIEISSELVEDRMRILIQNQIRDLDPIAMKKISQNSSAKNNETRIAIVRSRRRTGNTYFESSVQKPTSAACSG